MEIAKAYHLFSKLSKDHFCLSYMGAFDDDLTETLMRNNETSIHEPQKLKKRLAFLIAECFQNIIRHSDEPSTSLEPFQSPKIFILRNIDNIHYISSTNIISNSQQKYLSDKLEHINNLSPEELKEAYLGALATNEVSEKGGAGLGLIEMARKSGSPLDYSFDLLDPNHSIFYFQVRFAQKDNNQENVNTKEFESSEIIPIDQTKELYRSMMSDNIILLRKGDFSQESILPIIGLLEGNLKLLPNFTGSKKKTMYVLIEMLQNISKHAAVVENEREGILLVSQNVNGFVLTTGNYVDNEHVPALRGKLQKFTNLTTDELTECYKDILLNGSVSGNGNAGIGLIELCKYSKSALVYSIVAFDDTKSFYSLSIEV